MDLQLTNQIALFVTTIYPKYTYNISVVQVVLHMKYDDHYQSHNTTHVQCTLMASNVYTILQSHYPILLHQLPTCKVSYMQEAACGHTGKCTWCLARIYRTGAPITLISTYPSDVLHKTGRDC